MKVIYLKKRRERKSFFFQKPLPFVLGPARKAGCKLHGLASPGDQGKQHKCHWWLAIPAQKIVKNG